MRLADQPALQAAIARGAPLLCVYIFEEGDGLRAHGGASRWWLHHSLDALSRQIEQIGGRLDLLRGQASTIVPALAAAAKAGAVFWNRRYGAPEIAVDAGIKSALAREGRHAESFNGALIHEPWEIRTKAGGAYGVYTPYWRAALALGDTAPILEAPCALARAPYPASGPARAALTDLDLLPRRPDWAAGLRLAWTPGETGARERLDAFIQDDLAAYAGARDLLAVAGTSRLSPHLRFGEISPRQAAEAAKNVVADNPAARDGAQKFLAELGWREFNHHVMFHHPDVATQNLRAAFDRMPWRDLPRAELDAWKQGRTGYPIVDAGMRELWRTGTMHNRVRMIAASFLVKHLLGDWRIGEAWFWDCLCDADPANNPMNWQWVAGTGTDASPFFRIFNPMLQGVKFDPDGGYVRRFVPELASLPANVIHAPWTAPAAVLDRAGVTLGTTYPIPMVDHIWARDRALAIYAGIKGRG